jgi:tight adherence protein C
MESILVPVLIAIVVFSAYLGIDAYFSKQQRLQQLKKTTSVAEEYYSPEGEEELVELTDELSSEARFVEGLLRGMGINVDAAKKQLRPKMQHAGINSPDAPAFYLIYKNCVGYLVSLLGLTFFLSEDQTSMIYVYYIVGLLMTIFGVFGAQLYVKNKTDNRQKKLLRAFPDTLDLMVVCVESGLALDAALARVTNELGRVFPEINEELGRTRLELTLLNDRTKALLNLGERTNIVAFRSLVAALIQTERFGTSLSDTLRVLSDDYRHTRLMIAENKAGRLPALMTIPLVCFLLPALFIIIMAPAALKIQAQGGFFGNN